MPGRTLARNPEVAYRSGVRPASLLIFASLLYLPSPTRADDEAEITAPPTGEEVAAEPLAPKVAIVIAGDPDPPVKTAASTLGTECRDAGLRTPSDPALRGALVGDAAKGDDGLDGVRALRRGLGVDPRKDLESYKRLGTIAGADALVVLRREGDIKLEVFDVSASQFYEGMLDFDEATPEARVAYVKRRASTAQARWAEAPAVIAETPASTGAAVALGAEPVDEPKKKRWIKKAWPYFVVGALLAGGVTYIIVDQRRTNDPGPALLRFRPGDQ